MAIATMSRRPRPTICCPALSDRSIVSAQSIANAGPWVAVPVPSVSAWRYTASQPPRSDQCPVYSTTDRLSAFSMMATSIETSSQAAQGSSASRKNPRSGRARPMASRILASILGAWRAQAAIIVRAVNRKTPEFQRWPPSDIIASAVARSGFSTKRRSGDGLGAPGEISRYPYAVSARSGRMPKVTIPPACAVATPVCTAARKAGASGI